jgi:glycosyltransferase involved in cell wall biosynthesis
LKILGLFLNNELRTGGHIRCLELMEGLAAKGNQVVVLLNEALQYEPRHFSGLRLAAAYRRKSYPPASLVFRRSIESWLDGSGASERPDLVIALGETHFPAALAVKKRLGAPILFGYQSNTVREATISLGENLLRPRPFALALINLAYYRRYETRIARTCDAIVFQSPYDRDDYLSRNPRAAGKSFVVGGNIGPPRFTEESRGKNRGQSLRKILFMGTLGERKGLRYLVEAFGLLWAEGRRDLELHVAGPGLPKDRARYESFAAERGFAEALTFYGRVPSTFPLMEACDLMVAPSLFDSYPDVILLALHSGIPVIGSRAGGIPDMLADPELLFPPRDAASIAAILRRCLDEPGYYARLRAASAARREVFLFDWPAAWERVAMEVLPT